MMRQNTLVYALAVLACLLFVGMGWHLLPLKPSLIELQFTFTPEAFANIYKAWTYDAKGLYQAHFAVDYVFIFVYAAWGFAHAMTSPSMRVLSDSTHHLWAFALPLAGFADGVENILHQHITAKPMLLALEWPYWLAGSASTVKWSLGLSFLGVAVYAKCKLHSSPK